MGKKIIKKFRDLEKAASPPGDKLEWIIGKGDLVKISSSNGPSAYSYGVVLSPKPYTDQQSLFPIVKVFSFARGCEEECYPYNLEVVSTAA